MSSLTLSYNAGDERRHVRATRSGRGWLVLDELGEDKRVVELVDALDEAAALARDYVAQATAAGHPLVRCPDPDPDPDEDS